VDDYVKKNGGKFPDKYMLIISCQLSLDDVTYFIGYAKEKGFPSVSTKSGTEIDAWLINGNLDIVEIFFGVRMAGIEQSVLLPAISELAKDLLFALYKHRKDDFFHITTLPYNDFPLRFMVNDDKAFREKYFKELDGKGYLAEYSLSNHHAANATLTDEAVKYVELCQQSGSK
jgi:hypothetical protein